LVVDGTTVELATDAQLTTHAGDTSNPHAVTKTQVGLGNVDNTSDASKPVSTLQAAADAVVLASAATDATTKADAAQAAAVQRANHTGTQAISTVTGLQTALDGKASSSHTHAQSDVTNLTSDLAAKAPLESPTFTGTVSGVTKSHVGLGNVDNTADASKPVSTAQAAADTAVASAAASALSAHEADTTSVHGITDTTALVTTTTAPELIRDTIATALVAGTNVTITPNDGADTITIAASGGGGGGAVATDTIFDAKGDLPVGTGSDTAAKLTVGANGTRLEADSSQSTGLKWVGFVGVKAYRSTGYTLAHEAVTTVPWDAEEWDTDGFHDNSTNSQRLTVPTGLAGKYLVIGSVGTTGSGSYARFLVMIQKNGTDVRGGRTEGGISTGGFPVFQASTVVDLAVGDYVTVSYYQSSGTTRAMDTANCAFSMHKIG
jgi:hypothetical protein